MNNRLDLTSACLSFPELEEPEISRRNLIDWLHDRFSPERKVIVVQGVDGAGKTTLLAQFAQTYSDRTFSYFVKKDIWSSNPQQFLVSLCEQMYLALYGSNQEASLPNEFYQLRQYFGSLYNLVAKKARREQLLYYFVIDGLEWVSESYGQESIIDLLPTEPPRGIYLLVSSHPGQVFIFQHDTQPLEFFSPTEVDAYLREIGVQDKEKIGRIYDVCRGMPGYLAQIRRELAAGLPIDEVVSDLPKGFEALLEREWVRIKTINPCYLSALEIMAYSELSLDLKILAEITGIEQNDLQSCLSSIGMIRINHKNQISFVTDAHKRFVASKLPNDRKARALEALMNFYERNPFTEESFTQLPVLYKNSNRYDALKSILSVSNLTVQLHQRRNIYAIRRALWIVADAAKQQKDFQALSYYSLMGSALKSLTTEYQMEAEVQAFLSLEDYDQAFILANKAVLAEDRLEVIAEICEHMKRQGRSIPNDVMTEIERLVREIDPTGSLQERVVEIAASLFYVHHNAAMDLLEKVSRVETSGRSMDMLLTVLALRLEGEEPDSEENVRSRITDQSLQQFVRVNSPVVAKFSPEQVLKEIEGIEDLSAKLFVLRSWCNANRDNPDASIVINQALELMTASVYSNSMRHLRQFAEPLRAIKDESVLRLVDRFDLLKATALKKPAEEVTRLELLLAAVEARNSPSLARQRLLNAYLELDNISEVDARSYAQVRILLSLPEIDSSDPLRIREEINKRLPVDFGNLLLNSADHFAIVRKLLRALTNYDPSLAMDFAVKINTVDRRDEAYGEILRVYTDRDPSKIDLQFLEDVLEKIVDKSQRDYVFVKVLESASEKGWFNEVPQSKKLMSEIPNLLDPNDRCFAFAYTIRMLAETEENKAVNEKFDKLMKTWEMIDKEWERIEIGYQIVAILAKGIPDKARALLNQLIKDRTPTPLINELVSRLYIQTLNLCLRAFSDILKDKDYPTYRQKLIDAIQIIPSLQIKCRLFADLSLRHYLFGKEQDFKLLVKERVLTILEYCREHDLDEIRTSIVVEVAPCLYEYGRELFKSEVDELTYFQKDGALRRVIVYILSGRSLSDPVNLDKLADACTIDREKALRVSGILDWMEVDTSIYNTISALVNLLVKPDPKDKERDQCVIVEKQALHIAETLNEIVNKKLPDTQNIKHDGYKVVSLANIAKLRSSSMVRASDRWHAVAPSWHDLAIAASNIPNLADKVLVMTWVGEIIYKYEPNIANNLLDDAGKLINDIPTIIDRGNRLHMLANVWKSLKDNQTAKHLLQEAMKILQDWTWDQNRDQLTGAILQQAHAIDPEFAASLTSMVDNPLIERGMEQFLAVQDLRSRPDKELGKIEDLDELLYIRGRAAANLLESLCSGKPDAIQTEDNIVPWVYDAFNAHFKDAYYTNAWYIENSLHRTSQRSGSALVELFMGLLDNLRVVNLVGQILAGAENQTKDVRYKSPLLPEGFYLFPVGSSDEATSVLKNWIDSNASGYLKICDAYFKPEDLKVITSIPNDIRVHILALRKAQIDVNDDRRVEESYKQVADRLFGSDHPEIHFYIFGTKSTGDGPLHDRYYITSGNKGIQIGTSVGGLGNKDTALREMEADEVAKIESDYVDRMRVNYPSHYHEEKLSLLTFTLRGA